MADEDQGASAGDTAAAPDGVSASTSTTKAQRRVKLYQLNDAREWDDKGTGHVKTARAEGQLYLEVHSEDGDLLLMESNVSECCRYQRQQGTLIVWQEPDEQDLAVSFQDQNGCVDIWAQICEVRWRHWRLGRHVATMRTGPHSDWQLTVFASASRSRSAR